MAAASATRLLLCSYTGRLHFFPEAPPLAGNELWGPTFPGLRIVFDGVFRCVYVVDAFIVDGLLFIALHVRQERDQKTPVDLKSAGTYHRTTR